jgi:hypothetical protein
MELRTINSTWYEVVYVGGYGAKLDHSFATMRDAQKAILIEQAKALECNRAPVKYHIMHCVICRMVEDNGDVVSETIIRTRTE